MILEIIKYTDFNSNKLRLKNIDVKKENPFLQELITNMFETLDSTKNGVGLAAPQVGHNLNLFVIKTSYFQDVFINPEIHLEGLNIQGLEGCLSLPDLNIPVSRRERVKVRYYDRNWVLRMMEFKEQLSIIIQHEYDHLKGKLIID